MELLFDTLGIEARAPDVASALDALAAEGDAGRGAVFTRPVVATAILDLVGYTADRPLHRLRLLEPSFGTGDFLLPALDRLLDAYFREGGDSLRAADDLAPALRGVELHRGSADAVAEAIRLRLMSRGVSASDAARLCEAWLVCDDFLLCALPGRFNIVVGNPPYVRQERIPPPLLSEYRRRYLTMYDRADLYIPFFERSLDLLDTDGCLGFICANRWIKNRYGGPLRDKIASRFHLRCYIDMEDSDAFHSEVIAYPAITIVARRPDGAPVPATRVASAALIREIGLEDASSMLSTLGADRSQSIFLDGAGDAPWLLDDVPRLQLLRRLERQFPPLEAAGCKVGIGVATGCDRVFIGDFDALPVEPSRKLPLALARDLVAGEIRWGGKGVVNPFEPDGRLACLDDYPRFAAYLHLHRAAVAGRHVATRNPRGWYRTIDRINPALMAQPKLLVPDIKGESVFVLDEGHYYPHHNLYYITSSEWPLPALQCVLSSSIALMFVATYCTRMSGGYLRFQAQYLRRIRLPPWQQIEPPLRKLLATTPHTSTDAVDFLCAELYQLGREELATAKRVAADARVTFSGINAA